MMVVRNISAWLWAVIIFTAAPFAYASSEGITQTTVIYENSCNTLLSSKGEVYFGIGSDAADNSCFGYSVAGDITDNIYIPENSISDKILVVSVKVFKADYASELLIQPVSNGAAVFANMALFTESGEIKTGAGLEVVGAYTAGEWYTVTAAVNKDLSYELYINGEKADTLGMRFSNRLNDKNEFSGMSRLKIIAKPHGAESMVYLDDIKVCIAQDRSKIKFTFENGGLIFQKTEKNGTVIDIGLDGENHVLSFEGTGGVTGGNTTASDSYVNLPYVGGDYEFELDVKNNQPQYGNAVILIRDWRSLSEGDTYIRLAVFGSGSDDVVLFPDLEEEQRYEFEETAWHHVTVKIGGSTIYVCIDDKIEAKHNCSDLKFDFSKFYVRLQATLFSQKWTPDYLLSVFYDNIIIPGKEIDADKPKFYRLYEDDEYLITGFSEGYLRASCDIDFYGEETAAVYSALARYEGERLVNVSLKEHSLSYGENRVFHDTEIYNTDGNTALKIFVFKDISHIVPITECGVIKKGIADRLTPREAVSKIKNERPMLLASAEAFEKINMLRESSEEYKKLYNKVIENADKYLEGELPEYNKSDGLRFSGAYTIEAALLRLMFAYKVTGDTVYAERARLYIEQGISYKDWNTSHFLDTAALAKGFGIAYDWGYDYFDEDLKSRMAETMLTHALNYAIARYESSTVNWDKWDNNWNFVCNCGMTAAALAIAERYPEQCGKVIAGSLNSLDYCLAALEPDGGWYEGYGYWKYGVSNLIAQTAMLESAMGDTFGITNDSGMKKTAYYPIYMTGSTGNAFNYADGGSDRVSVPELLYFGRIYGNEELINERCYELFKQNFTPDLTDLIWLAALDVIPQNPEPPNIELIKYFRGDETVTMRSEWDNTNAMFAGIHGGKVNANHAQMDKGSFVFEQNGVRWAIDLGSDNYNLYNYFDKTNYRWWYYRNRAEGHNTIIVNPSEHTVFQQELDADARVINTKSTASAMSAVMDMASAYSEDTDACIRGIKLDTKNDIFIVQDEISFKNEDNEIYWFMHTKADIDIAANGKSAVLSSGTERVYVQILGANTLAFDKMAAVPLDTSPNPDTLEGNIANETAGFGNPSKQNANDGIQKLCIHQTGIGSGEYTVSVAVVPLRTGQIYPDKTAVYKPIANW